MFWAGMIIFAILAVLPITAAIILNKSDGSQLNQPDPEANPSENEV